MGQRMNGLMSPKVESGLGLDVSKSQSAVFECSSGPGCWLVESDQLGQATYLHCTYKPPYPLTLRELPSLFYLKP